MRTLDALTGVVRYQFAYDDAGRLASPWIATATSPPSSAMALARDGYRRSVRPAYAADRQHGWLSQPHDEPGRRGVQLNYTAKGLLTRLTNPRGESSQYTYDGLGLLTAPPTRPAPARPSPTAGLSAIGR